MTDRTKIVITYICLAILTVPIHEMGHYVTLKFFGYDIEEVKLLCFEKAEGYNIFGLEIENYKLGYVRPKLNDKNLKLNEAYGEYVEFVWVVILFAGGGSVFVLGLIIRCINETYGDYLIKLGLFTGCWEVLAYLI